ncbi:hypothetical protein HDU84_007962 [Entophlyctis sp. JEL0112]|nr:hypothetical protein HDU84_007962 [Entophlyctis sp. JEL0112]
MWFELKSRAARSDAEAATGIRTTLTRRRLVLYAAATGLVVIAIAVGAAVGIVKSRSSSNAASAATSMTLLIGLDGFRMDYLDATVTPKLYDFFQKSAVSHLQPVFPAQSFPNQYAVITGLLPARSGIVGDYFHSSTINQNSIISYGRNNTLNSVDNPNFWFGKPLWQSVQEAGFTSGTVGWPGSEAAINQVSPAYEYSFNNSQSDVYRANIVKNWTRGIGVTGDAIVRPIFIATHLRVMDVAGTALGADLTTLQANLTSLDNSFGVLMSAVDEYTAGTINVVVISDHGMSTVNNTDIIYYEDLFDITSAIVVQNRPMGYVYIQNNTAFDMTAFNTKMAAYSGRLTAYVKGVNDAPGFANQSSDRIPDVLLVPAEGGLLKFRTAGEPFAPVSSGSAGYDNTLTHMQAVFAGYGPAFKANGGVAASGSMRTVDVYAVLASIVGNGVSAVSGVDATISAFSSLLA